MKLYHPLCRTCGADMKQVRPRVWRCPECGYEEER